MPSHIVTYTTEKGIIFVEATETILTDDDRIPAGAPRPKISEAAVTLDEALTPIKTVASSVVREIEDMTRPPDEVAVGFGIKLTGTANALIASGSAEVNLEVTLTWKLDKSKLN